MEEIEFIIETAQEEMGQAITHLKNEFTNIRAGKASPNMLRSVMVDYYGSSTPLSQISKHKYSRCTNHYCTTMGKKYAWRN